MTHFCIAVKWLSELKKYCLDCLMSSAQSFYGPCLQSVQHSNSLFFFLRMSAKPTLFSFLLCHSFPAVASKSYITTNYSRRHGKVPVPFALHGRAMVVCVSVPFLFCSVQITLAVCTCSYTVEYHSILPPYCSGNFTQELETSEQLVKRY